MSYERQEIITGIKPQMPYECQSADDKSKMVWILGFELLGDYV
jgi:hypothetical protein